MNSLEELQQTLALLQRIQGVTSALQKRVQAVSSLARGALDSVKIHSQQLSVLLDEVLAKLKSEVKVTWQILVQPTWQALPSMTVSPQLEVTPKLKISSSINLTPKVQITPKLTLSKQMALTPKVKVTPQLTLSKQMALTPKVQVTPQLTLSKQISLTPKVQVTPQLTLSKQIALTPKVQVTPQLTLSKQMALTPNVKLAPKATDITPKVNVKPELNIAPTLTITPTLSITPKVEVNADVSGIKKLLNGLKKAFNGLFAVLRASVVGFFGLLRVAVMSTLPALFAFSAALLANPLTWVVVGIVALGAAIVGLIVYWDQVTAAVGRFFDGLMSVASPNIFEPIRSWWAEFSEWLAGLNPFTAIASGWQWIKALFAENSFLQTAFFPLYAVTQLVDGLLSVFDKIPQWWQDFKAWLMSINPFESISKGIKKFAGIFGFSFGDEDESKGAIEKSVIEQQAMNQQVALPGNDILTTSKQDNVMQSISQQFGGQQKSTQVDKIEVHNHSNGVRGEDLMYEIEMVAG